MLCAVGSASAEDARGSPCDGCVTGESAPAPGLAACSKCSAGTYSDRNDMGICKKCAIGKFSDSGVSCQDCRGGSYAPGEGYAMCISCPPFQSPKEDNSGCQVIPGFFIDAAGDSTPIPKGVKPDISGMTLHTLDLSEGYWRTSLNSTEIILCLNNKHCKGGPNITDQCYEGYIGPLCAVCDKDYAGTGTGKSLECNMCTGDAEMTTFLYFTGGVLAFVFFILFYIFISRANVEKGARSFREDSVTVRESGSSLHQFVGAAKEGYISFVSDKGPIVKIIFSFYQIVTMLPFVLDITFPPLFTKISNFFGSIVNLNFVNLMPIGCIMPSNFHHQMMGYTLIPLAIAAIMISAYQIVKIMQRRSKETEDQRFYSGISNEIFSLFLFMTFLILPTVSIQIFSTFACRELDDGTSYLKVDYSIDCEDPVHHRYVVYAAIMILPYPIGIPLMYHLQLKGARHFLDPGQKDLVGKKIFMRRKVKSEFECEFTDRSDRTMEPLDEDWEKWVEIKSMSADQVSLKYRQSTPSDEVN